MSHIDVNLDKVVSKIENVLDLRNQQKHKPITQKEDVISLEEYMTIDDNNLLKDLSFYKQLQQGYLSLPQLKWDKQELLDIINTIDKENKWLVHNPYPETFHRGNKFATATSEIPSSILKQFKMKFYSQSGFSRLYPNSSTPPHPDNNPDKRLHDGASFIPYSRECAIFFPVEGDFNLSPTNLYKVTQDVKNEIGVAGLQPKEWSNEKILKFEKFKTTKLTLNHPTLIRTQGKIWHGVDNPTNENRTTFQISFNSPYTFEAVAQLFRSGLINVL